MNSLFEYFVKKHNLYLTEGELEDIRCAVLADILPSGARLTAEKSAAAIESLWEFSPCVRTSADHRAIKASVDVLQEIVGMGGDNG